MDVLNPVTQKLKFYTQPVDKIKDPYAQISNSGFTVVGNNKTYAVANLYDRPEPTRLNDIRDVYTVPYNTTPFLGNNVTIRKNIDVDSVVLRPPVNFNKKSAIDISQVTIHPQKLYSNNPDVSDEMNNFYNEANTINEDGSSKETKYITRFVNRWDYVDPRVVQNVDNIIMNMKYKDGRDISLPQCGLSTRNELRNYVEINNC
jgi:hypothetical protein